jgi:GNAT superfamily N-acetyltransferase
VNNILFRLARVSEVAELEALQLRASLVWEEYRDALLANPEAVVLPLEQIRTGQVEVAERAGRVIGFSVLIPQPACDAELDGLFVDPAYWRLGIGRKLVDRAAARAFAGGATRLRVVASPRAAAFYESCGFDQLGQEPTRFGPALTMSRLLTP